MKTTTEFQLVSTDKLIPYVNNARTHSPEQIMKLRSSLREFGFVNPVIIDRDFNVLAGHGRIQAAKAENIPEVPCVFADHLTEAQKKDLEDTRTNISAEQKKKSDVLAGYASKNDKVHQLIDIALLQNGMLKGAALDKFLKRTVSLLG